VHVVDSFHTVEALRFLGIAGKDQELQVWLKAFQGHGYG
jgi:hypothetical protein